MEWKYDNQAQQYERINYYVLNKQPAALFVRDGKLIQDTVATATTTSNKLNRDGRSISNF